MYEIQSKTDFQSGVTLTVRIPEQDLDKKAFYTILNERPDFILPFHHRVIDGQIEFTYQVGNRSKLAYLSGSCSPSEYADLWIGMLQPLLDCGDWFMTPYSFVLKPEYLYCDKSGKTVSFVYIPSVKDYSGYNTLKSMVTEIAKQNHVTDINLENKVVWAIQDFNPNDFLKMIKTYKSTTEPKSVSKPQYVPVSEPKHQSQQHEQYTLNPKQPEPKSVSKNKIDILKPSVDAQKEPEDIAINFPNDGKKLKEKKPRGSLLGSLLGRKKKKVQQQEIIEGAAVIPKPEPIRDQPVTPSYTPVVEVDDDLTQLEISETGAPKFRYVGIGEHPRVIEITIKDTEIFTIGRFDASVGTKQCSFEFDKKTKAVSRRHAVVEKKEDGYFLVDLDSAAGTFVEGQKIISHSPFKLERGYKVSFGHSGADYVWEE